MDKVRIGIIGLGNMGTSHAKCLFRNEIPGGELAAVCDNIPDCLHWAKENFGEAIQVFDNVDALLTTGKVDAGAGGDRS